MDRDEIIIYHSDDGKAKVTLYARDSNVWMNQMQPAELFNNSKQNIGQYISNIFTDRELNEDSVVNNFLTTAIANKFTNRKKESL